MSKRSPSRLKRKDSKARLDDIDQEDTRQEQYWSPSKSRKRSPSAEKSQPATTAQRYGIPLQRSTSPVRKLRIVESGPIDSTASTGDPSEASKIKTLKKPVKSGNGIPRRLGQRKDHRHYPPRKMEAVAGEAGLTSSSQGSSPEAGQQQYWMSDTGSDIDPLRRDQDLQEEKARQTYVVATYRGIKYGPRSARTILEGYKEADSASDSEPESPRAKGRSKTFPVHSFFDFKFRKRVSRIVLSFSDIAFSFFYEKPVMPATVTRVETFLNELINLTEDDMLQQYVGPSSDNRDAKFIRTIWLKALNKCQNALVNMRQSRNDYDISVRLGSKRPELKCAHFEDGSEVIMIFDLIVSWINRWIVGLSNNSIDTIRESALVLTTMTKIVVDDIKLKSIMAERNLEIVHSGKLPSAPQKSALRKRRSSSELAEPSVGNDMKTTNVMERDNGKPPYKKRVRMSRHSEQRRIKLVHKRGKSFKIPKSHQ